MKFFEGFMFSILCLRVCVNHRHFSGVICTANVALNPDGVQGTYACTACRKRFATAHGLEVTISYVVDEHLFILR